MSRVIGLLAAVVLAGSPAAAADRHDLFTRLVADVVTSGVVDYPSLKGDARLQQYCDELARTDPSRFANVDDQLAFWINAYNAYTLKVVPSRYPLRSINELHTGGLTLGTLLKKTVWDRPLATVNGRTLTLNAIEHEIIRARFHEPRAHFALVCASRSCPALRSEAYEGGRLDAQLDDQARTFMGDPFRNAFDVGAREARISKIFDWFSSDFGASDRGVLAFIARFAPGAAAVSLRSAPGAWRIRYKSYDWGLNDRAGR